MAKSRAEIQRAYRQRLKEKNNAEYLRRERERMRRNYVPSAELSERDRKRRNEQNREKLKRFYERRRAERLPPREQETSGYESENNSVERGRLRVRMPFVNNRRKAALRRWKRDMSEATSRIRLLEQERSKLFKKYKSARRSIQRMKKKENKIKTTTPSASTPMKQTENEMTDAGLSEEQKNKIRKPLLLSNVMISEVKHAKEKTPRGLRKALHTVVSGKIAKKYKCVSLMSKKTGLCRHRLGRTIGKEHQILRGTRLNKVAKFHNNIIEFLTREDNSKLQPGKKDNKKVGTEKKQIYILSDYLSNLYTKFEAENPEINISFSSFSRCRPKHILLTSFSSRNSCLCTKHQNAALTIKLLKSEGIDLPANPEKALDNVPNTEELRNALPDTITWSQWTRVEVQDKDRKKYVTKVVDSQLEKEDFLTRMGKQMIDFKAHVQRVTKQYEELKTLKQNLPEHEMILQLDFAENYTCRSMEEVQSAYFNQTTVTLHPAVAYFRSDHGVLEHKSTIVVSDEMGHKASTVVAFIDEIIPILKGIDNNVQRIHYWSDSPTSQYRNKHILDIVANHEERYGIKARWNYFEAGHGKSVCDGLGGSCKRLADEAMRSGKARIQDANDFFKWATNSNMKNVKFIFVSADKCAETETTLKKNPVRPVKGTMKIHGVVGLGHSKIKIGEVSCYCPVCIAGNTCDMWIDEQTRSVDSLNIDIQKRGTDETETTMNGQLQERNENAHLKEIQTETVDPTETEQSEPQNEKRYKVGDHVAAVYEGRWYLGEIVDEDDDDYEVKFMEEKKRLFQWPRQDDIIWRSPAQILMKINAPEATGKYRRMFKLEEAERDEIMSLFQAYNEK